MLCETCRWKNDCPLAYDREIAYCQCYSNLLCENDEKDSHDEPEE